MDPTLVSSLYSDEAENQLAENDYCGQNIEENDERPILIEVKFGVEVMQAEQGTQLLEMLTGNKRKFCASSDIYAKRMQICNVACKGGTPGNANCRNPV